MVDPINPSKLPSHNHPQKTATPVTTSNHSEYKLSDKALAPFKKMFPSATTEELTQIFNNMMKSIASAIQQDQKFHEEQRDKRKEESGDDGEF